MRCVNLQGTNISPTKCYFSYLCVDLNRFFYLKNCFESMPVSVATLIGIFLFKVNLSFSS